MLVDPPAEDWLMWRRTYGHRGHSPLVQINTTNVGGLRLAWAWTMREGRQETTPLVHDGMMFLVEPCDFVEALDVPSPLPRWTVRRGRLPCGGLIGLPRVYAGSASTTVFRGLLSVLCALSRYAL